MSHVAVSSACDFYRPVFNGNLFATNATAAHVIAQVADHQPISDIVHSLFRLDSSILNGLNNDLLKQSGDIVKLALKHVRNALLTQKLVAQEKKHESEKEKMRASIEVNRALAKENNSRADMQRPVIQEQKRQTQEHQAALNNSRTILDQQAVATTAIDVKVNRINIDLQNIEKKLKEEN